MLPLCVYERESVFVCHKCGPLGCGEGSEEGVLGVVQGHGSVHPSAAAGHEDGERGAEMIGAISNARCPRRLAEHNSWCHKLKQSSRHNSIFSIFSFFLSSSSSDILQGHNFSA